ncbi:MAG: 3-dehydroquinate synthase [Verrucomicrobiales bacterium]|nr:3-dehydroquinate synthase [Verrucomicrobiales bacterium]
MIERRVSLSLPHRVFFTEGVFDAGQPLLRGILCPLNEKQRSRRVLVVVEPALVAGQELLLEKIHAWFAAQDGLLTLVSPLLVMEGGEPCKNDWRLVEKLWAAINDGGIDRHSYVIAIGGGALLDLVGFAAATAHRGIRLIRMPTTTLSQGDGGVGVKNGVNHFQKKNWVGTFAVPFAVINDFRFLESLPSADLRDGIIEAVKVSLIRDEAFFQELEAKAEALGRLEKPVLHWVIERSADLHTAHICTGGDPFEFGSARPLDFGHWIAHKLEQLSNFRIGHGRAVAIGMAADLVYASLAGMLEEGQRDRILSLLEQIGFRLWDDDLLRADASGKLEVLRGLEEFREHLGGDLCITLVTAPGQAVEVHEMDAALVEQSLVWLHARESAPALN